MAKRIKKPIVKPEQRKQWLRRYEAGESASKIADSDDFDVRTVRRHIEHGQQEREVHEARLMVLRSALESHYADLCRLAEQIDLQIMREARMPLSVTEDRMWSALRQHLPRSPLWAYLSKWDELQQKLDELRHEVTARLEKTMESDSRLSPMLSMAKEGVVAGMVAALAFQLESWSRERGGLTIKDNLHTEPAEDGFVNVRYGFAHMGKVSEGHLHLIREMLGDHESRIVDWPEYSTLQKLFQESDRLKRNLRDELAVVTLRRIVPGRCKYCPL